jgi:hypothetical protein
VRIPDILEVAGEVAVTSTAAATATAADGDPASVAPSAPSASTGAGASATGGDTLSIRLVTQNRVWVLKAPSEIEATR